MVDFFVSPDLCTSPQLLFLTAVYAYVLYQASDLISGGSELLMLVPAVAGIVGSIVLPILGAVPDGMMVLFSGIGPNAQSTVAVGVGALAGSTVMLLTIPWFICIVFGSAPIVDGTVDYASKAKVGIFQTGIQYSESIGKSASIMLATTMLFFIIQIPASLEELIGRDTAGQAAGERFPAFLGLGLCCCAFAGYLVYCFLDANEDKQLAKVVKGIESKQVTIAAALKFIKKTSNGSTEELLNKDMQRLRKVCKPFFKRYDYNKDATLTCHELKPLLHDLGYWPNAKTVQEMLHDLDKNSDGMVCFDEFTNYLYDFMRDPEKLSTAPSFCNPQVMPKYSENDDDGEEEMPEDLADLSPRRQMMRVVWRATWMMGLGTALVLLFADPMVDCLNEWGTRLDVSPFYISFILAPFASNASELISAYTYAVKKSEKNMTTSLSTLIGAACMNNTFVLAIFLCLVYVQGLAWQFTAETLSMVLIQWIVGLLAMSSRVQTLSTGLLILMCYPGCLALVWLLENVLGFD